MAETTAADPKKVVCGPVRIGYANVFRPRKREDDEEPSYSCMIIIDKTDRVTLRKIAKAIEAAQIEGKAKIGNSKSTTLRDGDEEADLENNPELAGMMYVNISSKQRPGIVDQTRQKVIDETMVYSGCYVNVSMKAFAYNAKGNKGVSFGLNHIQFVRDGEPLGGMTRAEDDFEDVETEGYSLL
jgi:hypothetical protein